MKTLTKKQQLLLLAGLIVFSLIYYFRFRKKSTESNFSGISRLRTFNPINNKVRIISQTNPFKLFTKYGACSFIGDWMESPSGPNMSICPSSFSLNDQFTGYYDAQGLIRIVKINKSNGEIIYFSKNENGANDYPFSTNLFLKIKANQDIKNYENIN